MCGTLLEVAEDEDGLRRSCETCARPFDVRLTQDVQSGQKGVSLVYHSGGNGKSGETSAVGSSTTSYLLPSAGLGAATNPLGPLMEPEPPEEAHFRCSCQKLLAISKGQYEKRSRCPACGARMIVFMLFDPGARSFTLQTFSLIDATTGATAVLTAL